MEALQVFLITDCIFCQYRPTNLVRYSSGVPAEYHRILSCQQKTFPKKSFVAMHHSQSAILIMAVELVAERLKKDLAGFSLLTFLLLARKELLGELASNYTS